MTNVKDLLELADANERSSDESVKKETFDKMNAVYEANKENAQYLWRLARAEYNYAQTFLQKDEKMREKLMLEGWFLGIFG